MSQADHFLATLAHEIGVSRPFLQRLPENRWSFKPHPKSSTLSQLTTHLVEIPGWAAPTALQDVMDIAPGGKPMPRPEPLASVSATLERFDRNVAEARTAIARVSDQAMAAMWTMQSNGVTMFAMPRQVVLSSFILHHLIHHRAQLGLYLRLCEVKVPSTYGPTADEGTMGNAASA